MSKRSKGATAERELVSMLWGSGLASFRAAGSGAQRFYCPDVIASNGSKVLAIECKSTKYGIQYLRKEQVRQLIEFAKIFKAEPWIAIKFGPNWKFYKPEDLKETEKSSYITYDSTKAKIFRDLFR